MIKVVLDAGHGPKTAGKRTPKFEDGTFMHEHEFNSSVVGKLKNKLIENGSFNVTVSSSDYRDVPLSERVERERNINSDLFLSVHANALNGVWGSQNGIESYSNIGSTTGGKYCEIIQEGLLSATGLTDRGCKTSSFYVLKNTYGPAVLVECGFMDNKEEARLLISDEYREKIAASLFESICTIFDVEVAEEPTEPEHWAEKYYNYLNEKGIIINERRFDDNLTRGEFFAYEARKEGFDEKS